MAADKAYKCICSDETFPFCLVLILSATPLPVVEEKNLPGVFRGCSVWMKIIYHQTKQRIHTNDWITQKNRTHNKHKNKQSIILWFYILFIILLLPASGKIN